MTKSVKRIIVSLGLLSIAAGAYEVSTDADFSRYFFSFFIGITLIGTVFFDKEENQ